MNIRMSPLKWATCSTLSIASVAVTAAAVLVLSGCGGGAAAVGGSLSGLGSGLSLTLQNNGADNLTLSANGSFSFATTLVSGATYNVTVLTQPVGQSCSVANGSGTIDSNGTAVNGVAVSCVNSSSLGGTVSGLNPGTSVTLNINGYLQAIAGNGAFAYPGVLSAGSSYTVTVAVQPVGQTCTVSNGSGTISTGTSAAVTVTCG